MSISTEIKGNDGLDDDNDNEEGDEEEDGGIFDD